MPSRIGKLLTLAVSSVLMLPACLRLPPTETPIPQIEETGEDARDKTLIVMLPGRGDRAETFVTSGFIDIGRQHDFDVIAVDAHFGYYRERSLLPRLHSDVIKPAQDQGYENIWLLGVSMGGFGSLLYAQAHPEAIDGVILLAPYVGSDKIVEDVKGAGTLSNWDPAGKRLRDYEVGVWQWLQAQTLDLDGTPVFLGYGRSDSLAGAYGPLHDALQPSRVFARDGEHKWTTWTPIWASIASQLQTSP